MDIISAYREAGTYRGAAAISGTTPKTVRRVIARHEAGGAPVRAPRARNYDAVAALVAERVRKTAGRISAKPQSRPQGRGQIKGELQLPPRALQKTGLTNIGASFGAAWRCVD